jgi:hypothetical protein
VTDEVAIFDNAVASFSLGVDVDVDVDVDVGVGREPHTGGRHPG